MEIGVLVIDLEFAHTLTKHNRDVSQCVSAYICMMNVNKGNEVD